jgi:DNA-binding transcriptional regulator YdaS (Cro superfamily)
MTFTKVLDMNVHIIHTHPMKLSLYLDEKRIGDAAFASEIGVSRSMVTKLRRGLARPSAETAMAIQSVTDGAVMLSDLMEHSPRPVRPEATA